MAARRTLRQLTAGAALAVDGVAGLVVVLRSPADRTGLALTAALVALACAAAGVWWRRVAGCAVAAAVLGAAFMAALVGEPVAVGAAAVFGVLLYAGLELGSTAIAARATDASAGAPPPRRGRTVWVTTALAVGGTAVVAVAGAAGRGDGLALLVVGSASALLLVRVLRTLTAAGGPRHAAP